MWDLSGPGIEPVSKSRWILNHWTTREVPDFTFLMIWGDRWILPVFLVDKPEDKLTRWLPRSLIEREASENSSLA